MPNRLRTAVLVLAIGVAFADSSIVVLGVPEIVRDFDVAVGDASWVITSYNLAVVAAAAAVFGVLGRFSPRRLAFVGLAAFTLASIGCALAPSFGWLVGFRTAQGLAAALVLVAALPFLGGRAGIRAWILAATVGLAAGPALGGVLTELFSWRSIFAAQAPLVAAGLLALGAAPTVVTGAGRRPRRAWLADATLAAFSAALVGALFLVVVLLINGFGWQPLPAALVATTLPVAAAVAERIGHGLAPAAAAGAGGVLVACGLTVLAFLPSARTGLVVAGLALGGAGLGLAAQPLGRLALGGPRLEQDAAWTVFFRHAGLVLALVVVTPVLVSSLDALEQDAEAVAGEVVLRSELPLTEKARVLNDLADAADASEPSVPDVRETLAPREGGEGTISQVADDLTERLHELIARAFRDPFLLCAAFGLGAALLGLGLGLADGRVRAPALAFAAVALVAGAVALGADYRLGALDDPAAGTDPCRAPPAEGGDGLEAAVERIALDSLSGAACELGVSRAAVLRELAGETNDLAPERLEESVRRNVDRALEAETERGTLDGTIGSFLRGILANAPLDWIREALGGL